MKPVTASAPLPAPLRGCKLAQIAALDMSLPTACSMQRFKFVLQLTHSSLHISMPFHNVARDLQGMMLVASDAHNASRQHTEATQHGANAVHECTMLTVLWQTTMHANNDTGGIPQAHDTQATMW